MTLIYSVAVGLINLLIIVIPVKLFAYYWTRRRMYNLISKMPGPTAYPIFGNSLAFLSGENKNHIKILNYYSKRYGSVVRLWLGQTPFVLMYNKNDIENILNDRGLFNRGEFLPKVLQPTFMNGLFVAEEDEWRFKRRVVQATFHTNICKQFLDIFVKNSANLANRLKAHANDIRLELSEHIGLCALDIVFQSAFSYDLHAQNSNRIDFLRNLTRLLDIITGRFTSLLNICRITKQGDEFQDLNSYFQEKLRKIIDERYKIYLDGNREVIDAENVGLLKTKPSLLDVVISTEQLSKSDIMGEVMAALLFGGEVVMATCCYALCLLAEHQDIQEKVLEEQRIIFLDNFCRPVTLEDLDPMLYLEQVVRETLRLFPPVPHIIRKVEKEIELEDGNILPVGCFAYINLYISQRDPQYFPDPENFNPDHFCFENTKERNSYAYTPFGAGRRTCVAEKYAIMEIKVILSTLLRRYHFLETVGGMKTVAENLQFGLLLKPAGGFNVKFVHREIV